MNRDYDIYFPKKSCYPNQREAMDAIYQALIKKQIILFEGACGTGKTLSALAPALQIAKMERKTVVIATNMHQQMDQFIEEAREIKKQADIKVIVLKGKMLMCPNPDMDYDTCKSLSDKTYKLLEQERDFPVNDAVFIDNQKNLSLEHDKEETVNDLKNKYCEYLLQTLKSNSDGFREWLFSGVHTPEDVEKWALKNNSCGYELLKKYMKEADLLICNYNHFLDEGIRGNVLGWMNKDLKDIIAIFDEAHNIESAARKHSSTTLTEQTVMQALDEIKTNKHPLFSWDDDIKLIEFLKQNFDLKLVVISSPKTDNGMTINLSDGNTFVWLRLDDEKTEVRLKIGEMKYKFIAKEEDGRINVYNEDTLPSQDVEIFLRVFLDTLKSAYNSKFKFGERERVGKDWYDLRIADPEERVDMFRIKLLKAFEENGIKKPEETIDRIRSFGLAIDKFYERQFIEGKSPVRKISNSLAVANFLSNYMKFSNDSNYYPILGVKRQNNEIYGRLELFTCIPKNVTAPLFNSLHAGVLMSATLAPFDAMKRTLGITHETCELAFGLTFPKENRLTIAVSVRPLFAKDRDDPETKELITKVLSDIIEQSDGNVLIFFPSFDEAKQYKKRLKCNVPVFLDEKGVCAQTIKDEFFKLGEKDKKAVLLSYMWGTLTEGVDYKDRRGRTVVIVGVGYPALNDRTRAVEAAYEAEFGHGWDYAIEIPTIRKVRQALGRVVRSPDDYGVRVLLDSRYSSSSAKHLGKYSVFNIFPKEERAEIIDVKHENVKYSILNFFNEKKKEKQMMQTENEKRKRQIEYLESDNKNRENKIKESDYELTEIEKSIEDIYSYINSARCYSTNPKKIDNDPSIEKRAKRYYEKQAKKLGLSGKSPSELQGIIENKENELENLNKRKDELILNIKEERDSIDKNNKQLAILREKISPNNIVVQEIDKGLYSISIDRR